MRHMRNRPGFIIDLDGTILARSPLDGFRLYFGRSGRVGKPFSDAARRITESSRYFTVIALTARYERGRANTRKWLDRIGLGFVEVYHSPYLQLAEPTRRRFKTRLLKSLVAEGYTLAYGAGARPSDFAAYAENGLFPIVVLRPHQMHRLKKIKRLAAAYGLGEGDYAVFIHRLNKPAWGEIAEFVMGRSI